MKWPCALVFAVSGIAGAAGGAQLGKMVDGSRLLDAVRRADGRGRRSLMLRPRKSGGNPDVKLTRESMPKLLPLLIGIGFGVGALSGFFGIGGGFLIVPGLMGATAMPLINAIGSSLVSVTAFGLTTAASYACIRPDRLAFGRPVHCRRRARRPCSASGWPTLLPAYKHALTLTFSGIVIAVGLYCYRPSRS